MIERTLDEGSLGMTLYRPFGSSDWAMRFKVFVPGDPIVLSQVLPMLEHLGLRVIDEVPHAVRIVGQGVPPVMIHDFGLQTRSAAPVDLGAVRANFQEAFLAVWQGRAESDLFNALVLAAGLSWREVVIVRAYCRYLRQVGIAFSQAYMEQTLIGNPALARLVVALFKALFDPAAAGEADARAAPIREAIAAGLDQVASADQDRILRRFFNLVEVDAADQLLPAGPRTASPSRTFRSSSTAAPSTSCRCHDRCSRSSSTRRGWRASTCAAARWRAAASAGRTGARTSAPRSSA